MANTCTKVMNNRLLKKILKIPRETEYFFPCKQIRLVCEHVLYILTFVHISSRLHRVFHVGRRTNTRSVTLRFWIFFNHRLPGVEIETKCYPWDFSPILNHPVIPICYRDNCITMTFKMGEKSHGWHLVSISTSERSALRSYLLSPPKSLFLFPLVLTKMKNT